MTTGSPSAVGEGQIDSSVREAIATLGTFLDKAQVTFDEYDGVSLGLDHFMYAAAPHLRGPESTSTIARMLVDQVLSFSDVEFNEQETSAAHSAAVIAFDSARPPRKKAA